jgi:hypothetical protein
LEIASGREIEIPSRWKMANSLGASERDLYDILYRTLSSFCHSEVTNFRYFVKTTTGFLLPNPRFCNRRVDFITSTEHTIFLALERTSRVGNT